MAAAGLKGTMKSWDGSARRIRSMMKGHSAFDEALVADALRTYAADAARLQAQIAGGDARAQDFKRRFAVLQTDAQTALSHQAQRATFANEISRVMGQCESCHAKYDN